jgi:hypothetical protein
MTQKKLRPSGADWKALLAEDADLMRELVRQVMQEALEAEMTEALGGEPGERTESRLGYRAGYYPRTLVTRVGKLELRVPRDREGRSSTELFERYQRSEKALVSTLAEMYVQGVSTRAPHPRRAHIPQPGELPTPDPRSGRRDPRRLAGRAPLSQHAVPLRTEEGGDAQARRSGLIDHSQTMQIMTQRLLHNLTYTTHRSHLRAEPLKLGLHRQRAQPEPIAFLPHALDVPIMAFTLHGDPTGRPFRTIITIRKTAPGNLSGQGHPLHPAANLTIALLFQHLDHRPAQGRRRCHNGAGPLALHDLTFSTTARHSAHRLGSSMAWATVGVMDTSGITQMVLPHRGKGTTSGS